MARWPTWKRARRWFLRRRIESAAAPRLDALMRDLAGKRIAIVGNSASLLAARQGALIDSHDLVVRMNNGFPIDPAAQGSRIDIWCFSNMRMALLAPAGFTIAHAVWMSPKLRQTYHGDRPCCFYPMARWRLLRRRLGARPSVGAMAIDLVAQSAPAAVAIFGFDFKRSATFYNNSLAAGRHDFAAESRYVLAMAERPGWRFVAPAEEP